MGLLIGLTGAEMRIATISGVSAILLASCSSEPVCQNELQGRSISPDGKWSAVIFSRNCGATVGRNYQVSIVPGGAAPTGKGNVLVADGVPSYSDRLKPVWSGSESVTVPIPSEARVFTKSSEVGVIKVKFRQM